MLLSAQRARSNRAPTECVDCDKWRSLIMNDIQQNSARQSYANLRNDQYDDTDFDACLPTLKRDLRGAGYSVWKVRYVPKNAAIAQDEDWEKWVAVDWSNSWGAWWRNTKDLIGFHGVYKAWN